MRSSSVFAVLLALLVVCLAAQISAEDTTTATSDQPKSRTINVFKDGLPYPFELKRAAELSSPLYALRRKVGDKFKEIRYRSFLTLDGRPLDDYAVVPEEGVVVQRPGDSWFWPGVRTNYTTKTHVEPDREVIIKTVAPVPRIFTLENFISSEEAEYMFNTAKRVGVMVPPPVAHPNHTGSNIKFDKSFYLYSDPIFHKILKRAANLTRMPIEFAEAEMFHFGEREYFGGHGDAIVVKDTKDPQRLVTVTVYLNNPDEGGATIFPGTNYGYTFAKEGYLDKSVCSDPESFALKPAPGVATMHYVLSERSHSFGLIDQDAVRFDCAVVKGEKMGVNFFFYNRRPYLTNGPTLLEPRDELPTSTNADGSINVDASV